MGRAFWKHATITRRKRQVEILKNKSTFGSFRRDRAGDFFKGVKDKVSMHQGGVDERRTFARRRAGRN